jgi:RNA polymerase sigma-70 factor (ECF subfamily)
LSTFCAELPRGAAAAWPALPAALFAAPERVAGRPGPDAPEADAADVRGSLAGDGEAYARLVRRWQGEVARWMRRFARGGAEREELVHDVFVEAYLSLGSWHARAPFGRWLRSIATRAGYRRWKLRSRECARTKLSAEFAAGLRSAAAGPAPEPGRAGELLDGLLAALPPRDRLALTLLYVEGRSVAEAAELAGWSRVMVKVQAHRARGRLRRLLERAGLGGSA